MERAWLALTEQGLAVQPMMSLLVLDNVLTHGDESLKRSVGCQNSYLSARISDDLHPPLAKVGLRSCCVLVMPRRPPRVVADVRPKSPETS